MAPTSASRSNWHKDHYRSTPVDLPRERPSTCSCRLPWHLSTSILWEFFTANLKPQNVLRVGERVVLSDFGIARDAEVGTQDPTFKGWGSVRYMAPEVLRGESPTVKSDLYVLV